MLPFAFRFLETFLPATKPQEGWRSLQVTGFGLVWPPKSFFYPVSKLPPGSPQMLPCSCSLPPSPKKGGKARFQPWLRPYMAAKVIFYRVSKLPPGSPQMLPCSCSLPPSPQKGQPPSNRLRPGVAAKLIFLSGFDTAAGQPSNASVQLQPAAKPQEGWHSLQVTGFGLVWPLKSFFIRFRNCRRAALECFRAAAACHQAPQEGWQSPASALYCRHTHFLSGFEPAAGRPQMPPCSCSLPPSPEWQSLQVTGFGLV